MSARRRSNPIGRGSDLVRGRRHLLRPDFESLEQRRLLAGNVTLGLTGVSTIAAFAGVGFGLNPVALINCNVNGSVDNTPGDFQAQIDWGDGKGQDSTAKLVADGNQVLVKGTHNYTTPNTYHVTVTVNGPGGSSTSSMTTQVVVTFLPDPASRPPDVPQSFNGPQPLAPETLGLTGVSTITSFAGVGFTLNPVALVNCNYNGSVDNTPGDFKVQVNWGDSPSWDAATQLVANGNQVLVKGTHVFQAAGLYDVTVYVTGPDGQTTSAKTTQVSVVKLPDVASLPAQIPAKQAGPRPLAPETLGLTGVSTITSFAGVGFALNPVALVNCTYNGSVDNTPSDFQVQVNWGDSPSWDANTKLVANGNQVLAKGTHVYQAQGTYDVTVYVTGPDGQTVSSTTTQVSVQPLPDPASRPPQLPASQPGPQPLAPETLGLTGVSTISSFAGVGFALNPVALISCTFNGAVDNTPSDFKAQVNWGDGPSWDPVTSLLANGNQVLVKATHIYQTQGTYDVTVYVTGPDGQTTSSTTTHVNVTPLPEAASRPPNVPTSYAGVKPLAPETLGLTGVSTITANVGVTFPMSAVALISCNYNGSSDNAAGDFKAQVNWGDGPSWDTNTTLASSGSQVRVSGSHQYQAEGVYSVTVYVTGPDGQTVSGATTQVDVTPAPVNATGVTFAATEGAAFSGTVAAFTDANTLLHANDFDATIAWGDGTTSAGDVASNGPATYVVSGTHTYADEHTALGVMVTISGGGASDTANSTANVADAPLTASGLTFSATVGASFNGTVASFTDANTAAPVSDFTANVTWGDGTTSSGTVSSTGNGHFTVSGIHTYTQPGSLAVVVAIHDVGGSSAQANSTANAIALGPPSAPVLAPQSDTGVSNTDRITKDNGSPSAPLTFIVGGVSPANGFVQLYDTTNPAAPVVLGGPVQASNGSATVTLTGVPLADGVHSIAATAAASSTGNASALSPATTITIQMSLVITGSNPANGSVVTALANGQVTLTFSHPLAGLTNGGPALSSADPYGIFLLARGPNGSFTAPSVSAATPGYYTGNLPLHANAGYQVNGDGTSSIVLSPTIRLSSDVYLVSITLADFSDLAGNTLTDPAGGGYRSFLLQLPPTTNQPLMVTGVTTYNGFTGVNNNLIAQPDTLAIGFNKALYPGAAQGGNVKLIANPGPNFSAVSSVAAYSPTNNTIYLTPTAPLNPGTVYLIQVSATVSDDQGFGGPGVPLGQTFFDSFTVSNPPAGAGQGPFKVVTDSNGNPPTLPSANVIWNQPMGYASVQFTEKLNLGSLDRYSAMLVPESLPPNPVPLAPNIPLNSSLAFNPNTSQLIIVPTEPSGNNLLYVYSLGRMNASNGDPLLNGAGQPAGVGPNAPYFATFALETTGATAAVLRASAAAAVVTQAVAPPVPVAARAIEHSTRPTPHAIGTRSRPLLRVAVPAGPQRLRGAKLF